MLCMVGVKIEITGNGRRNWGGNRDNGEWKQEKVE